MHRMFPDEVTVKRGLALITLVPPTGAAKAGMEMKMTFREYSNFQKEITFLAKRFASVRGTIALGKTWEFRGKDSDYIFSHGELFQVTLRNKKVEGEGECDPGDTLEVVDCNLTCSMADNLLEIIRYETATQ